MRKKSEALTASELTLLLCLLDDWMRKLWDSRPVGPGPHDSDVKTTLVQMHIINKKLKALTLTKGLIK